MIVALKFGARDMDVASGVAISFPGDFLEIFNHSIGHFNHVLLTLGRCS
jgi:hypothetical protein